MQSRPRRTRGGRPSPSAINPGYAAAACSMPPGAVPRTKRNASPSRSTRTVSFFCEAPLEDRQGERILDQLLDRALHGPSTELPVIAPRHDLLLRLAGDDQFDLLVGQQGFDTRQLQVDDALEVLPPEVVEDDDVVNAVEELGPESASELVEQIAAHAVVAAVAPAE